MISCPICGKEFDEKTGRRPKRFCSEPCKIKFWNANKKTPKKESVPEFKQSLDETPKEVIKEVDKKIEEISQPSVPVFKSLAEKLMWELDQKDLNP